MNATNGWQSLPPGAPYGVPAGDAPHAVGPDLAVPHLPPLAPEDGPSVIMTMTSFSLAEARAVVLALQARVLAIAIAIPVVIVGWQYRTQPAILAGAIIPVAGLMVGLVLWRTPRTLARSVVTPASWRLSRIGLDTAMPGSAARIEWSRIARVTIRPRLLELRLHPAQARGQKPRLYFPMRCVPPGDLDTIGMLAAEAGIQLRRGGTLG